MLLIFFYVIVIWANQITYSINYLIKIIIDLFLKISHYVGCMYKVVENKKFVILNYKLVIFFF